MANRIKVLYVAGWGRSGSTILDNVLGQIDGFFSAGELCYVWDRNVIENRLCGCGRPFRECPVWMPVMETAFGGMDGIDAPGMVRLRDSSIRTRHVPLMLAPRGNARLKARLGKYTSNLDRLYRGIQEVTRSRVIVDSSKLPSYGHVLGIVPTIDLYVVHLVRDSRAVTHSWLRKKLEPDTGTFMRRHNIFESPLIWSVWNFITEVFWRKRRDRYLRLRYEDFIDDPQEAVERILHFVDERIPSTPLEGRIVELGINHTVGGNPSRFKTGSVELRPDEEWKAKMKPLDRAVVTALSWPLLRRYGY